MKRYVKKMSVFMTVGDGGGGGGVRRAAVVCGSGAGGGGGGERQRATKAVAAAACDGNVWRRRACVRACGWCHVETENEILRGKKKYLSKMCPDINLHNVGGTLCKFVFL